MTNGNFHNKQQLNLTLLLSVVFLVFFWIITTVLFSTKLGYSPQSIAFYYLGNAEHFQPARNAMSMLEVTHSHTAMLAVVLLLITHLLVFVPLQAKHKRFLTFSVFISGFVSEAAPWAIRYISADFAWFKLCGFIVMQLSVSTILILLLVQLVRHPKISASS